ncbi:MlaD family protein [Streptomyces melanogenes]|uniref:MlaD family protein n=1 Tax=Streptomyces melanogenes TaxID=67326 RepID=A0ABZ1XTZ1_9ACTN|nr:MlaD family protein [Streptomyces melanogenes]
MRRAVARGGLALCAAAVVTGLAMGGSGVPSFHGIEDLPLPGGADLGSHPYRVTAVFKDVTSLFPQSSVKVNDVAVGRVEKITVSADDWLARVTMKVNGKVRLPADAFANLEQSSLLGEKYVQLVAPGDLAPRPDLNDTSGLRAAAVRDTAPLADGAVIPLARTNRNAEVEEVFGALSMLLNGGGVQQINTITRELNRALDGRQSSARSVLTRISTFAKDLDAHRGDLTNALGALDRLSSAVAARDTKVGTVLDRLGPGLQVLRDQRGSLVTMLKSLDTLSTAAVGTVDRTRADLVADLRALAPTLKGLADAGRDLPASLQVLMTYPFTDEVLTGVKGDYLNVYLKVAAAPGTLILPAHGGSAPPGGALPLPSVGEGGAR